MWCCEGPRGCDPHALGRYFTGAYLAGELFEGPEYRRCIDDDLQVSVLEHVGSGVKVWTEALDLRASAPESEGVVLFRYAGPKPFARAVSSASFDVAKAGAAVATHDGTLEALAGLADEGMHFGRGVYACESEPGAFASKGAIVLNNHGPRHRVGRESGAVCDPVLRGRRCEDSAAYCLPILVPECFAHDIWQRPAPDLDCSWGEGCNRFGEQQWAGRDVWVVQLSDEGEARLRASGADPMAEIGRKRLAHLERSSGAAHPDTLVAVGRLAALLHVAGRMQQAEELSRRALRGWERLDGPAHVQALGSMNSLVVVLKASGKLQEAEPLMSQASHDREVVLGPGHRDTLISLHDLGILMLAAGRTAEALPLLWRTLEGREVVLGDDHPATLAAMDDLVRALKATGQLAEAEALARRALTARHGALGPGHPDTLTASCSLVALLRQNGNYGEAEEVSRRALAESQEGLGPLHFHTVTCANNLAVLLKASGRLEEAEPLFRQVLEALEKTMGPQHRRTLACLRSLGLLLESAGRFQEAEALHRRALAGREATLEPTHTDVLNSLDDLGRVLVADRRHEEAEPICWRALENRERVEGPSHPRTLDCRAACGLVMYALGKTADAVCLIRQAAEGHEATLGPLHPQTLYAKRSLAMVLADLGQLSAAEPLAQSASEGLAQVLGPSHADALGARSEFARLEESLGDHAKAEPLYRSLFEECQGSMGPSHPDTLSHLEALARTLEAAGRPEEAKPLQRTLRSRQGLGSDLESTLASSEPCEAATHAGVPFEGRERHSGPQHLDASRSSDASERLPEAGGDVAGAEASRRCALDAQEAEPGSASSREDDVPATAQLEKIGGRQARPRPPDCDQQDEEPSLGLVAASARARGGAASAAAGELAAEQAAASEQSCQQGCVDLSGALSAMQEAVDSLHTETVPPSARDRLNLSSDDELPSAIQEAVHSLDAETIPPSARDPHNLSSEDEPPSAQDPQSPSSDDEPPPALSIRIRELHRVSQTDDMGHMAGASPLSISSAGSPQQLASPRAGLRAVKLGGFKTEALNDLFVEMPMDELRVNGQPTFWSKRGWFLYHSPHTRTWGVARASRLDRVRGGQSRGLAHSPESYDLLADAVLKPPRGWREWDAEAGQWDRRPGSGLQSRGRVRARPAGAAARGPGPPPPAIPGAGAPRECGSPAGPPPPPRAKISAAADMHFGRYGPAPDAPSAARGARWLLAGRGAPHPPQHRPQAAQVDMPR